MYNEHRAGEFDKIVRLKGCGNVGNMLCKECFEHHILDVPCRHKEKLIRHPLYGERVHKIGILGHDDGVVTDGQRTQRRIGGCDCLGVSRAYAPPHVRKRGTDAPNGVGDARQRETSYGERLHTLHLAQASRKD